MTDESETGSPNKPNTLPTLPEAPSPHARIHTGGVSGKMTKIMGTKVGSGPPPPPDPHRLPCSQ